MDKVIQLYYLPEAFVTAAESKGMKVGHTFSLDGQVMAIRYIGRCSRMMPEGPVVAIGVSEAADGRRVA